MPRRAQQTSPGQAQRRPGLRNPRTEALKERNNRNLGRLAYAKRTALWRPFRASFATSYSQGGATRLAPRSLPWADMWRPLRGNRSEPNRSCCQDRLFLNASGSGSCLQDSRASTAKSRHAPAPLRGVEPPRGARLAEARARNCQETARFPGNRVNPPHCSQPLMDAGNRENPNRLRRLA